jgi:hypothetical protein
VERVYKVSNFLYCCSYAVIIFEILLMIGIVYYIYEVYGQLYATFGPLFILLFVPVWYYIQVNNPANHPDIPCGVNFTDSEGTDKIHSASRLKSISSSEGFIHTVLISKKHSHPETGPQLFSPGVGNTLNQCL